MKKIICATAFFYYLFLFISLGGCNDYSDLVTPYLENKYREIAYNSLSEGDKESLTTDYKQAPVYFGTYQKEDRSHRFISEDFTREFALTDTTVQLKNNQQLVAIYFSTKLDALLGPINLFIDTNTHKVIGHTLRY